MINEFHKTPEEVGHEPIGIGARGILFGLACVVGAMFVAMLMIAGLMAYFAASKEPTPVVGVPGTAVAPPPGVPPLEPRQAGALAKLRERERRLLTEYAWVDREAGVARIPITRAIEILAENFAKLAPAQTSPQGGDNRE